MTNGEYQLVQLQEDALRHLREFGRFGKDNYRARVRFSPIMKALALTIDSTAAELTLIREERANLALDQRAHEALAVTVDAADTALRVECGVPTIHPCLKCDGSGEVAIGYQEFDYCVCSPERRQQ